MNCVLRASARLSGASSFELGGRGERLQRLPRTRGALSEQFEDDRHSLDRLEAALRFCCCRNSWRLPVLQFVSGRRSYRGGCSVIGSGMASGGSPKQARRVGNYSSAASQPADCLGPPFSFKGAWVRSKRFYKDRTSVFLWICFCLSSF